MRFSRSLKTSLSIIAVLNTLVCLNAQKQSVQGEESQVKTPQGMPPRATPGDYQAQAPAGSATIAAEFMGHSVPTPEATFTTQDYLVVETGIFGARGARIVLSPSDFSLRVNGKKEALPGQPYGLLFRSLKSPEWDATLPSVAKSKGSIGGGGQDSGDTPAVIHMPIEVQRAMEQRVQKASLPEGNRELPQAGLIFFQHGGKIKGIHSIELIYSGAAGKATLPLQP